MVGGLAAAAAAVVGRIGGALRGGERGREKERMLKYVQLPPCCLPYNIQKPEIFIQIAFC